MKVMISSLLIIALSLLGLAVVEWLPRMVTPVTPAYAVGFAIYPDVPAAASVSVPASEESPSPIKAVDGIDAEGVEGSVSENINEEKKIAEDSTKKPVIPRNKAEVSRSKSEKQSRSSPSSPTSQPVKHEVSRPNTLENAKAAQTIAWAERKHAVPAHAQQPVTRSRSPQHSRQQARQPDTAVTTGLTVQVLSAVQKKPVKANVYIQRENGVHVSRKRYVERARFALKPGRYKVTVRADGHQAVVRSVHLGRHALQQTFVLQRHQPRHQAQQPQIQHAHSRTPQRQQQAGQQHSRQNQQRKIQQAAARQAEARQASKRQEVARYQQARHTAPTQPQPPVARHGRLQLHAVSATDGQPLAVNFRITSSDGRTLHYAPRVAYAEMSVPVGQVRIHIDHQGLSGSEIAQIQANAITAHTFSVVPPAKQVAVAHAGGQRYVIRPRLGLGVGIGPLVFRIR